MITIKKGDTHKEFTSLEEAVKYIMRDDIDVQKRDID